MTPRQLEGPVGTKPCLGCGGVPHVVENLARGVWEVRCQKCPTFTWGATVEEAVTAWQRAAERYPKIYAFVDAPVEIHWIDRNGGVRRVEILRFNHAGKASA